MASNRDPLEVSWYVGKAEECERLAKEASDPNERARYQDDRNAGMRSQPTLRRAEGLNCCPSVVPGGAQCGPHKARCQSRWRTEFNPSHGTANRAHGLSPGMGRVAYFRVQHFVPDNLRGPRRGCSRRRGFLFGATDRRVRAGAHREQTPH